MSLTRGSQGNSESKERRDKRDRKRCTRRAKAIRCEPRAQLFMHPRLREASLTPRERGGRGAAQVPHGPGTRGRGAPRGQREEGCKHPSRLRKQGSPRKRHTFRSPRLWKPRGGGWSRARSRPPEPPSQPRPPPPDPAVSDPLPQSLTRGMCSLGRGGSSGGDPRLGHDPRRVRQGCPTAGANLSLCGRPLLLWGWGSAGPGPPLPPPPPPLLASTAAAVSRSPQGRRPGGSAASTFPAPLPPAPPRPSAAAARHASSLPWVRRTPAPATQITNPTPGRLL